MKFFPVLILLTACIQANAQFDTLWTRQYNGPAMSNDEASFANPTGDGGFISAGTCVADGADILVQRYNAQGDTLWSLRYTGSQTDADEFFLSACCDASLNTYVAAWSFHPGLSYIAYHVLKINSNGQLIFDCEIDGMKGETNGKPGRLLAVNSQNEVFVAGTRHFNICTAKIDAAGDTLWTREYGNGGMTYDDASGLCLSGDTFVMVTGKQYINGSYDFCTVKYDSAGNLIWAKNLDGSGHGTDYAYAVTCDQAGNVFVAGTVSVDAMADTDFKVVAYQPDGDTMWTYQKDGAYQLSDEAYLIQFENQGTLLAGGTLYGGSPTSMGSGTDFYAVRLSSAGIVQREYMFKGSGNDEDILKHLVSTPGGRLIMAGESYSMSGGRDFLLAGFSSGAFADWEFNALTPDIERANWVAVDEDTVFAAGMVHYNYYVLKGVWTDLTGLHQSKLNSELQLYPIPCNMSINLKTAWMVNQNVRLRIFSDIGLVVHDEMLQIMNNQPVIINTGHLSNGMYRISITGESIHAAASFMVVH